MKKLLKRKMYHKRRKKEKLEERKKITQSSPHATNCTASYTYNNERNTKKRYGRNPTNNNAHHQNFADPITSYSKSLQYWWQTYCSAIEFHTKQQNADVVSQNNQLALLKKYADDYETSSEEDEENENSDNNERNNNDECVRNCVDEEYIKFLEITHKHQEELRLKRAEENS